MNVIIMHFYIGGGGYKTRCSTDINCKPFMFFIYISNCSKTIHGQYKYLQIIMINIYQF